MLYPSESDSQKNRYFEVLFEEHYDALVRYCFTIVHDTESARDIVQESFLSFWQTKGQGTDLLPAVTKPFTGQVWML